MLRTNKQTDKQTDSKILPKPTDIVGVGIIIIHGTMLMELSSCVECDVKVKGSWICIAP